MKGLPAASTWSCTHMMLVVLIAMWAGSCGTAGSDNGAGNFEMRMVYKYSEEFRELMRGRPDMEQEVSEWPHQRTPEFYHKLAVHDRHRHASRNLLTTDVYSLFPSNQTLYASSLGMLHYSFIALGTPQKAYFVALDTGSDLLWVPCDCEQCSIQDWATYGINVPGLEFAVYSPSNSTSSKAVACDDAICKSSLSPTSCGATQSCTYASKYLSANTSSSGTIVQDLVYLNPESPTATQTSADIYFGCGKVQTGDFLKGGAPNGLFGLGPEAYSVPSTLARNGVIKNVFSMCFSRKDGSGRLVFGREPNASLQSTPLLPFTPNVYYVLGVEGFVVGGVRLNATGKVVFDTGTSLTTLPSKVVQTVGDLLASGTTLPTFSFIYSSTLFSYCWNATTDAEIASLSSLSIVFGGGGTWTIKNPLLLFGDSTNRTLFACLGMVASDSLLNSASIIGFNFMEDYEYFFDQGASTFSWGPSDCSGTNGSSTAVVAPVSAPQASPPVESTETPPLSSKTPASPPPPPRVSVNDLPEPPTSTTSQESKASTYFSHGVPSHALFVLISTAFFLLVAK